MQSAAPLQQHIAFQLLSAKYMSLQSFGCLKNVPKDMCRTPNLAHDPIRSQNSHTRTSSSTVSRVAIDP